jgi:hypothetical protein
VPVRLALRAGARSGSCVLGINFWNQDGATHFLRQVHSTVKDNQPQVRLIMYNRYQFSAGTSDQNVPALRRRMKTRGYSEVRRTRQDQTRPTPSPEGGSSFLGRFRTA